MRTTVAEQAKTDQNYPRNLSIKDVRPQNDGERPQPHHDWRPYSERKIGVRFMVAWGQDKGQTNFPPEIGE